MAVTFPRPAFLSSIRAESESGLSNQKPHYQNLVHNFEVNSDKALLIMAANGRINTSGEGSSALTYTVNGFSTSNGAKFEHVYVVNDPNNVGVFPVGLYQLAEVGKGKHTVELKGYGSPFDLSYVTSQITVIPVNDVQYVKVAADWGMETPSRTTKVLLTANVSTAAESVLVLSTSFTSNNLCQNTPSSGYYQIKVDGATPYASADYSKGQMGGWSQTLGAKSVITAPSYGGFLVFVQVSPGEHTVELFNVNYAACRHRTTGAVLQVGIVPQVY